MIKRTGRNMELRKIERIERADLFGCVSGGSLSEPAPLLVFWSSG